jgi:PAS domain S-box-containing protein
MRSAPPQSSEEEARLRQALENAAAQWRTTFDAIASPIFILDLQGNVRRLNRAARDFTGRDYQALIGQPASAIGAGRLWAAADEIVARVAASRAPLRLQVDDPASGTIWDVAAHLRSGPEVDEEQVILVARDVTQLVRLQESLRRSELLSALGALVGGVAHQVRNPIVGLSAALDAFEARFGEREELRRYAVAMREPLSRLSQLVRDLLEYGKPSLAREPVAPAALAEEAIAVCRLTAQERGVELRAAVGADLPAVLVDRGRLVQALVNLIENAVQHSPAGAAVEVTGSSDARRWVLIGVLDRGPGVAADDLPRVFEPFFSRRHGGTGLGLALVQRIVAENDGGAAVANRPGGGAAFELRLPIARPAEAAAE